jgi:hypothetical protein
MDNLQLIAGAKRFVAEQDKLTPGALVSDQKISDYLLGKGDLGTGIAGHGFACPAGGEYTVNPIGFNPTCSIHGQAPVR